MINWLNEGQVTDKLWVNSNMSYENIVVAHINRQWNQLGKLFLCFFLLISIINLGLKIKNAVKIIP